MYRDPPTIQKLMCCITALHDLRTSNAETRGSRAQILASLESQVEELWLEYSSQKSTGCAAKTGSFDDGFTALTIAYFSSARILLGLLSLNWGDIHDSSRHCQVILDAALFLDISHDAIAYMRMATPLLLVALHSQRKEHHMGAVGIFEGWTKGTMRGISELALGAVRQHKRAILRVRLWQGHLPSFPLGGVTTRLSNFASCGSRSIMPGGNDLVPAGSVLPSPYRRPSSLYQLG